MRARTAFLVTLLAPACSSRWQVNAAEGAATNVWQCQPGEAFPGDGAEDPAGWILDPDWSVHQGPEELVVVDLTLTRRAQDAELDLVVVVENEGDDWRCPHLLFDDGPEIEPTGQPVYDPDGGVTAFDCIAPGARGVGHGIWTLHADAVPQVLGLSIDDHVPVGLGEPPGRARFAGYEVDGDQLGVLLAHLRGAPMAVPSGLTFATRDEDDRYRNIGRLQGDEFVLGEGGAVSLAGDASGIGLRGHSICVEVLASLPRNASER
jgi:hypothetical protein